MKILNRFLVLSILLVIFSSSILYVSTTQVPQELEIENETETIVEPLEISENTQLLEPDEPEEIEVEEPQIQTETPNIEPQTPTIKEDEKTITPDSTNSSKIDEKLNQTQNTQNSTSSVINNSTINYITSEIIPFFPPISSLQPLEILNNSLALHTEGRWIKDETGQIIFLKGVNKPSLEWRTDGLNWIESDWDTIESWNANVVRIPIKKSWWDNNEPTDDEMFYREKIAQAVAWGSKREIYTIIDMHWWDDNNYLIPMPSEIEEWINTWEEIANTYKNEETVLFDLWNEPHSISGSTWWPVAQECVDKIRATGAQNLILIGVLNYSHDAKVVEQLGPIKAENIVYSLHLYPHEFSNSQTVDGLKKEITDLGWKYILENNIAPVIIGEFGANSYKIEEINFMKALCRIANGQENKDGTDWRMSYLAWWFIPYPEKHALIYDDWETPTASGKVLIDGINESTQ